MSGRDPNRKRAAGCKKGKQGAAGRRKIPDAAAFPEENPFSVLRVDASGILLYANRSSESLLSSWKCRVGDPVPSSIRETVTACLEENTRLELEIVVDGRVLSFVTVPIAGQGYINFYGRDVTESKRAEEALRESEARLRSVLDNSKDVIYRLNVQSNRYDYISPSCEKVVGFSPSELMALEAGTALAMVHPDDIPAMLSALARLDETGNADVEYRQQVKSGGYRWLSNHIALVRDAAGRPLYRNGNVRDITARKRAEEALNQLNAELEQRVAERTADLAKAAEKVQAERRWFLGVLETLPVMISLIRPDYHLPFANRAYRETLGEAKGRRCFEYQFGRDKPCEECQAFVPLETGKPHHWEWTLPTGQTFDIHNLPFTDADGSPIIIEMDVDITERRKAEADLARHREHLEELVRERTAQLERANARLFEANRRKDEFLAMLGHELRNPLAAIAGALHLMGAQGMANPVLEKARGVAERQSAHMARMLDDLLDVSRITEGKVTLKHEEVGLADVIDSAVEAARPVIEGAGHRLFLSVTRGALRVVGDPVRLAQAIGNLLNNAAKYTPAGGEIHLTLERRSSEAAIRVRDNGLGIAPGLLPYVFDLFVQGERGPDRSQGGLGIGLTMAKCLVEMHGGRIEATSAGPGRGSEFTIILPLAHEISSLAEESPEARSAPPSHGRRILVVDDNVDGLEMLTLLLKDEGHQVRAAHDGAAALDLAASWQPDTVLLDIGMPGIDGYEVARRLKQEPALARTVLIALTGYGQEEDVQKSRNAGFDHHLVKPVDFGALRQLLGY